MQIRKKPKLKSAGKPEQFGPEAGLGHDPVVAEGTEAATVKDVLQARLVQLRAMAFDLTRAEQQERRRLAQLLHDGLQQLLVAARLKVGLLQRLVQDEPLHELLDQLDELLDLAVAESRSLTVELCPPVLHAAGLAAALEWLAQHSQKNHGLTVEVHADCLADVPDETIRGFLFQAVRELLFNIVKHAQTDHACVQTSKTEEGILRIEVQDDGVGCPSERFESRRADGGFGLCSIRERIASLGGQMKVESNKGKGTRVLLTVPAG